MNKYGYKEVRILRSDDLRNLCIKKNWYTCGNNEEYKELLNMCNKDNITTNDIVKIAENIAYYSKTEQNSISIMFDIARICNTFFEIE